MRLISLLTALAPMALAATGHAQDAAEGRALYADFCVVCHGESLAGDGPMADALTVAAPDLTKLARDGAFPIVDVAARIDGRDPLAAHGGEMPLFGRWFEGDGADVVMPGPGGQPVLLSRPIADLIAYLMENQS